LFAVAALFALFTSTHAGNVHEGGGPLRSEAFSSRDVKGEAGEPDIGELKLVTRLPAELPQRISSLAFDGEKIWVAIYHGRGRYATLDPSTLDWKVSDAEQHHQAIREVAGAFESPGGICFVNGKLWVAGSYGESFGYIDTQDWKVTRLFKGKYRLDDSATQSYSDMAYDGGHLWIAWHWFKYKLPVSRTQLLLKIDPETGKVIDEFPLPAGTRTDGTHGLAWDGTRLWHMKDSQLSAIEPSSGAVTAQYSLDQITRPNGLAWDGESLWIAEFKGKVWRLPF
jgi:sugar lactone lactonase YvrE